MGTYRKRNGSWVAEVCVDGRRKSKSHTTAAEAKAWIAEMESTLRAADNHEWPKDTVDDLLQRYSREVSAKKDGKRWEQVRLAAIARAFAEQKSGGRPLISYQVCDTPKAGIADWISARLAEVSRSTVQRDINLMRHVWTMAIKWGLTGDNPWKAVDSPGDNPPRDRRITNSEVRIALRALMWERGIPSTKTGHVALMFLIGLRTAMRSGEILQLGDANVDLEKRLARIAQHKTVRVTGKPREVPLTKKAALLLRRFHGSGDQWFSMLTPRSVDALYRKYIGRTGLEDLHFHDTRAEAITRLARRYDVLTLSRISGHSDLQILHRTYYRETAEDVAARL